MKWIPTFMEQDINVGKIWGTQGEKNVDNQWNKGIGIEEVPFQSNKNPFH